MKKYILSILFSVCLSSPVFAGWFEELQTEIVERNYSRAMTRCAQQMEKYEGEIRDNFSTMATYLSLLSEGVMVSDDLFYGILGKIGQVSQGVVPRRDQPAAAVDPKWMVIGRDLGSQMAALIRDTTDVHVLDPLVLKNLPTLLQVGAGFNAGDPGLSIDEVKQRILVFFEKQLSTGLTIDCNDQGTVTPVTAESFREDVSKFFDGPLKEQPDNIRTLISRVWTFSQAQYDSTRDIQKLANICVAIIENYRTGGGCMAGRINRMFRAYFLTMEEAGYF